MRLGQRSGANGLLSPPGQGGRADSCTALGPWRGPGISWLLSSQMDGFAVSQLQQLSATQVTDCLPKEMRGPRVGSTGMPEDSKAASIREVSIQALVPPVEVSQSTLRN